MIDSHCHILAGIDDGAMNTDISMLMAQMATQDGITRIVATPHIHGSSPTPAAIREATQTFNEQLKQWGVPISVIPGAEVPIMMNIDSMADYTIDNTSCILIEFPHTFLPTRCREILFQLKIRGYCPILAHPERHPDIIRDPKILIGFHAEGVKVQITADSLIGRFGPAARKCAEYLLKKDVVDMIASDAHSPDDRSPVLSKGLRAAARIVGREKAFALVTRNPLSILHPR